jgi:hypothetical protein
MRLRQGHIKDGTGYVPLTQNMWALCDPRNFHWLSQWNWSARRDPKTGKWYAIRTSRSSGKKTIYMHRVVLDVTDPKVQVDHVNRENTLDNRTENLRVATHAQNQQNVGLRKTNTSGFKGVFWKTFRSGNRKWAAQIAHDGSKHTHLGYFNTAVEAAAVWNFAAKRLRGEFAVLNDLSQVTEAHLGGVQ